MYEQMKVLVTGATGFIGFELSRRLAERGFSPRLMVRRPERGLLLRNLEAELVYGDLNSPRSLERAVEGMDTVIHLGARATFEESRLLRPTIVEGSVALMEAAAAAGVSNFVYASSLFVYPGSPDPIDASTPTNPQLDYGRAKVEAEERLGEIAQRSGMRLAVIRLPHVYGARDLFFSRISRGPTLIPGRGRNLFAHLHVHDAARVLIGVAESDLEGAWAVADRRATTWPEFLEIVSEYSPRFRYVPLPAGLARAGTTALRPFQRISGKPTITTPGSVVGWNLNLSVRPGLLWEELEMEPVYPTVDEGIPAVLDDCVAFRWLHPLDDRSS